jgi:hypothetical protein
LLVRLEFFKEQNKDALISCIELVLMSMGNTKYNVVVAKLNAYNMSMRDSYKDLEVLKTVLKEVYVFEYNRVISDIKLHLDDLVEEKDIAEFFRIMES